MTKQHPRIRGLKSLGLVAVVFVVGLSALPGCGEDPPVGLADRALDPAGKPSGVPTVSSTDPSGAPVDTTLVVRVLGSGYEAGTVAEFVLDGQAVPQVRTNSTAFVSSKELRANITIDSDAPTAFYDVAVTTPKGKRGIGIERFQVFVAATVLVDLGGSSTAFLINDIGEIVGQSTARGSKRSGERVVFWDSNGQVENLGPLPFALGGLSNDTRLAGCGYDKRAFVWSKSGSGWSQDNLPVPGGLESCAYGISGNGEIVVGYAGQPLEPAVWTRAGMGWDFALLPVLDGSGFATDATDTGLVVGRTAGLPVVWSRNQGTWEILATLIVPADAPKGVLVHAINERGDVVGNTCCANTEIWPLLWLRSGEGWSPPIKLDPPGFNATGDAINDAGVVAGSFLRDGGYHHAYLWSPFLGFRDLGTPNGNFSIAYDLNNSNEIVGYGGSFNSGGDAILWSPP